MSLRDKSDRLMEEAIKDLECGCYNKAVSAAYFSVRTLAEHVIRGLRTSKDDKIANALKRSLLNYASEEEAERFRAIYLSLFEARKRADHRPFMFNREDAEFYLRLAREIREKLLWIERKIS